MSAPPPPPITNPRARIVYTIWNNLPRLVLLGLVILIFILAGMIKNQKAAIEADKAAEQRPERPPINTVALRVEPRPITERLNLPGIAEPWTRLQLLAKISGTLVEVAAEAGDRVRTGDILARIEDDDYRIAVARAEAAYRLAEDEFRREEALFARGAIATATLDANRTRMQTAKADYDNARLMLSRTVILSPMDGIIQRMDGKVGLQLSVGDPVAEILETERMKGVIGIPESDVNAVAQLEEVEVIIQALADRVITARTHFLSPAPQSMARLYNLELVLDNPEGDILTGMFLRADIIKQRREDALAVPLYSVISRNDEQYVFIEEDGTARRRDVQLGIMEGWLVEVTDGLQSGDLVLIEGHRDVEEGQPIRVIHSFSDPLELSR